MLEWDRLRVFYAVAQAQSLTRAGETLGLSQSAVSRQISALEEGLKVTLFHRHARGLILTEQGEILFHTVTDVFHRLNATESALQESRERPKGPLKVTAPVALGTLWLTPLMAEFNRLYPDIVIHMIIDDRELDLAMREADVAIRLAPARQPDIVQKKLTTLRNGIYASQDYLTQNSAPSQVEDLKKHRLIAFGEGVRLPFAEANWLLRVGLGKQDSERPAAFRINNYVGILAAIESGLGVGSLPEYMVRGKSKLKRVLPNLQGPTAEVYLLYSVESRGSKRVGVFKEFLQRKIEEFPF